MTGSGEWTGVAIVMGGSLAVLLVAEIWHRFGSPKPEWTRKLVHVGGGMACLPIPFVIQSIWTVLGMAVSFAALLWIGGRTGLLRSVHSVRRKGQGSELYPFAILLLYILAHDRPWLYLCAVLVLAISDALAALVGSEYGTIRYDVDDEFKSLEGSLVFFVITFLAVHIPLLLLTDLPRASCVLVASMAAVVVTTIEALSPHGTDNLFVPFAVYVVIDRAVLAPVDELVRLNLALLIFFAAIAFIAWRTRAFNVGGTLAFILFTFVLWALGSARWALPIFTGFLLYTFVRVIARPPEGRPAITRVGTVLRAILAPLLVFLAAYFSDAEDFFYGPFLAAVTCVLAFTLWNFVFIRWRICGARRVAVATFLAAVAVAAATVPAWLYDAGESRHYVHAVGLLVLTAAVANDRAMGEEPLLTRDTLWPTSRLVLSLLVAAAAILLQVCGWLEPWKSL